MKTKSQSPVVRALKLIRQALRRSSLRRLLAQQLWNAPADFQTWLDHSFASVLTGATHRRCSIIKVAGRTALFESLETRQLLANDVISATSISNGSVTAGTSTIAVTFSEPMANPTDPANYELRRAGEDGLLLSSDTPIQPLSATWNGQAIVLTFDNSSALQPDTYRLTILDTLTDASGNSLDGDNDGLAGGNWQTDFVVLPSGITRTSTDSTGSEGNAPSFFPSLSADGRYVAFSSRANLSDVDSNFTEQIYVKDNVTGTIKLASASSDNVIGDSQSYNPVLSANGRFVTFWSYASNLVPYDSNGTYDAFVKDLLTGAITRVSGSSLGEQGNGGSEVPVLSGDGRYVVFYSYASNLVANDNNAALDVFLHDRQTNTTTLISSTAGGVQGNNSSYRQTISQDGRYAAFISFADNLVSGDDNGTFDIFVKDLQSGAINRVSTDSFNQQSNLGADSPSLSADGRYVAFMSRASNLVSDDTNTEYDIFLKDTVTGQLTRVSTSSVGAQSNSASFDPTISSDGRYVTFTSLASNLVDGDTNGRYDVFVKDMFTGEIRRISTGSLGGQGDLDSYKPVFSADGKSIAFYGPASNLVAGDTSGVYDTFQVGNPFLGVTDATTLTTPSGRSWEIARQGNAGQINQGSGDAFNGLNRLAVDGNFFTTTSTSTLDDNGRTVISATNLMSGLGVRREVTVPPAGSQDFARTIDVFTNPTGEAITVPVRLFGNLGTDELTTVFATSDRDSILEPTDTWFATDDDDPFGGAPAVVHLLRSQFNLSLQPTDLTVTEDNVDWTYSLTVPAGSIRRLATFTIVGNTRQQALDAVNALLKPNSLAGQATAYMTPDEVNSLANFQFAHLPTDIVLSTPAVPENSPTNTLVGTFSTLDLNAGFGDTFTYRLVSGSGDTGNTAFIISGNQLRTNAQFDFETQSSYSIRVRSTDGTGAAIEKVFTIEVNDLDEIAPKIAFTSFSSSGVAIAGVNTLAVSFDEAVLGGDDPLSYELRRAGADGLLLSSDVPIQPLSVTWNGHAYILKFDISQGLLEDTYRLTTLDTITDLSGGALDGDGNGSYGGDYASDFVVVDSDVQRVSTSASGTEGNSYSIDSVISGNGRYIAFLSLASNLVDGDQNGNWDIFRKDTWTGEIVRVSTDSSGLEANGDSNRPAISADGRYVAFDSVATNLVANDNNSAPDVFVKDLVSGELQLVSTNRLGIGGNADSYNPSISADGETIAFEGYATNLVDDPDTNWATDVFVKNWRTGTIVRASDGVTTTLGNGFSHTPALSGDGKHVAYFSDTLNTSGIFDVYLTEILTDATAGSFTRGWTQVVAMNGAGVRGDGASYDPVVNADGSVVYFTSYASNLADDANGSASDIFKKNLLTGELEIVSTSSFNNISAGASSSPSTDVSGRFVVFYSTATTLTEGDNNSHDDVFVKDTWTGQIALVSSQSFTIPGDHVSVLPSISADGRFITFYSVADNLLAGGGDNNGLHDVFVVGNPLAGVSNSVTLAGPNATSFEIDQRFQSVGQLIEGTHNAFDGLNRLQVGNTYYQAGSLPERTNSGRTIVMPSMAIDGIGVHREVTVPTVGGQDFVRTIEVFHNLTSEPLTQTVRLFGNLGSDAQTTVFATSDGDLIVEPTDTWFATDDADPNGGTPAIVHLLHSDYALAAQPSSVSVTEDNVEWSFELTLQAGEVARLASFTITGATRQAALDAVAALITSNSFDGQASTFLSSSELLTIRNFQFAQAPTELQLSSTSILENNVAGATIGQFTTIDANIPYGDTFAYTLTSGVGDQDNGIFEIVGSQLHVRESLDFETKSSYSLRVRSTDDAGLFIETSFTISVTDRDENIPTVLSTSFLASGYALSGGTSLTVTFSEPLVGGSDVMNYELRAAGTDGLLLQSDTVINPTSVTWSGNTATLNFASEFVKDTYRLTLRDTLADAAGNALDGDGDMLAGGDWQKDFGVLVSVTAPISRISIDSAENQANSFSYQSSISADGRFVAFTSYASNLVDGDSNGAYDIFVKDTQTGAISRISTGNAGNQANSSSSEPSISADGRFVAFTSPASNLVDGDTNGADIFVKETLTGAINRISTDNAGIQANSYSSEPSISADGRFVAFRSNANNLVDGDTNGFDDLFVKDTLTGAINRISTDNAGIQANSYSSEPSISADGRFVAFYSFASNLVDGDTNDTFDIFVKDLQTSAISRLSTDNAGNQANNYSFDPMISADGRFVAFSSFASNLVDGDTNGTFDVFIKDTQNGALNRISTGNAGTQANSRSTEPSISADGRFVAFWSDANNLVDGDTNGTSDIFVKDTQTGAINRLSTDNAGNQTNTSSVSFGPSISADGRIVAFTSSAINLVDGDTDFTEDIFKVGNPFARSIANTLIGPTGLTFDIDPRSTNAGQLIQGSSNTFDGLNRLRIDDVNFVSITDSTLDGSDRTLVTDTSTMSGLEVHREITVPAIGSQDFARSIDVFTNSSSAAITVPVRLFGNLGSDDQTTVFATSDGDFVVEPTDTWFATDDADPSGGAPAIVHWLRGENGLDLVPTSVAVTEDNVDWSFSLTVPAGATRRLATFTVLGATRQQAIDAVNALQGTNSFAGQAAAFLTADELNSLANFQFHQAPTDIQLSAASIAENNAAGAVIGTFTTSDLNAAFGDTFTYSSVGGIGDSDNAAFTIVDDQLQASSAFDYETKSTYTIRVRSTDAAGMFTEKTFSVSVTDLDEIAPKVTGSSLGASGVAIAGLKTLAITFDEPLLEATNPANYELRRAGSDGLLLSIDAPIQPLSVTWNGQAYVLKFDGALALGEDTYRLTILDTITDQAGNPLDGDNNNLAGGEWTTDFVVVESDVRRMSVNENGQGANDLSLSSQISADGRFVVFHSLASNLVARDLNNTWDIFRKDTWTGEIVRVSTDSQGIQANNQSIRPTISANGQFVAFESAATNLVPNDLNAAFDVFVKDLVTGELRRVSESPFGSGGNSDSSSASISSDGNLVAFKSTATNLTDDFDNNSATDIFLKNWQTGTIVRVSNNLSGSATNGDSYEPVISGDGTHVAFTSTATDLVANDTNGFTDVFVVELSTSPVDASLSVSGSQLVSVRENGLQGNNNSNTPALSNDGRIVYFQSTATTLSGYPFSYSDVIKKDLVTGSIEVISTDSTGSQAYGYSYLPSTNANGRYVAFYSYASSLVDGDFNGVSDAFVKDTWTGLTARVSSQSLTNQGNNHSFSPTLSADGRFITFHSLASNLLTEGVDSNGTYDIFVVGNPLANVSNSIELIAPNGSGFDIDQRASSEGQLIQGTNNAFDGLNRLQVGGSNYQAATWPTMANDGRTLVTPAIDMAGLSVHREITVPSSGNQDFLRTIEVLQNTTSNAITQTVRLFGNLGADAGTTVFATSDGDLIVEPTDSWFATDDADPNGGTPAVIHLFRSNYLLNAQVSSVDVTEDNVQWSFELTVQPGEVARLASFTILGNTRQQAIDAAQAMISATSFGGEATVYLSESELTSLKNFQFAKAPTDVLLSNNILAENNVAGAVVGTFTSIDPNTISGDTFTYTLVSGSGDTGNSAFTIVGNELRALQPLDFETQASYSVRVRSTDAAGLFVEKNFTVTVTDLDEIAPTVTYASFAESGFVATRATSLTVRFSEPVVGMADVANYELRAAVADGLLLHSDLAIHPTSVIVNGTTATLVFFVTDLTFEDTYRLTIKDTLVDPAGNALDGNGDSVAGGDWRSDFVVGDSLPVTRLSTSSTGGQTNNISDQPALSADGRYLAFRSAASNLVPGDTNTSMDIFVKDTLTGAITRASTNSTGAQANNMSYDPTISADGRYVTFQSFASNLVAGDTNGSWDIFVKDMITGQLSRVSTNASGVQASGHSQQPSISADGRYVAFQSDASNLVPGDTNSRADIFVKDTLTGTIARLSTDASSNQANGVSETPAISADGRFVAFRSLAFNLVAGDTNRTHDIFVKDRLTGAISRISTDSAGVEANATAERLPSISADGRYVAFWSAASNLVNSDTNNTHDVFVKDTQTGTTTRVSTNLFGDQANSYAYLPSISGDGRFVTFYSGASNLAFFDSNAMADVFVKDTFTGSITFATRDLPNGSSQESAISQDGSYVAFLSYANNLEADDTNGIGDLFGTGNVLASNAKSDVVSLVGTSGQRYDIDRWSYGAGQFVQGTNNAFDGLNRLRVGEVDFASHSPLTFDNSGRTWVSGTFQTSGLNVDRRITVPTVGSQDFARTIDQFTNPSDSPITTSVRLLGNLGSDGSTIVFATSDGDSIVEPTDTWFGTDDADPNGGTPAVIHLIKSNFGLAPESVSVIEDNIDRTYTLTIGPNETKRLATFTVVGNTRQQAIDSVNALFSPTGFAAEAATYLSAEELASLVNFQFEQAPTDILLSADSIPENNAPNAVIGTLATVDVNAAFGDTFSYSLVSGAGDTDNAAFNISGNELRANTAFDFETKSTYFIRVRSTDFYGLSVDKQFTVSVTDRDEIAPTVLATSFLASGYLAGGATPLTVTFSEPLANGNDVSNYELRAASTDGLLLQSDVVMNPTSVTWVGNTATLDFPSSLAKDTYRLTLRHALADAAGNSVVGNGQSLTGDWHSDFVVIVNSAVSLVTSSDAGVIANNQSIYPSLSANGRYVAFHSLASNLVPEDTNGSTDVFIKDRFTGNIQRVSTTSAQDQANGSSFVPAISADGRFVAFYSTANNLVAGDTNEAVDVFVKDMVTGEVKLVSADSAGLQADDFSSDPAISADGRYVAFRSAATNLVADDFNGTEDIFVKDMQTGTISRVSTDNTGESSNGNSSTPSISADGRYIAFLSDAGNLVEGDGSQGQDIYVKDRLTGVISRVSSSSAGVRANFLSKGPSISANGRYVAFSSVANNLVAGDTNAFFDIFVKDIQTGSISRVSTDSAGLQANSVSQEVSISADGRYVAFYSVASNLVPGDTAGSFDVFVKDTLTGAISRVSSDTNGGQANSGSGQPVLSADGQYVAFNSAASNLVTGDSNGTSDIFIRGNALVSQALPLVAASGDTFDLDPRTVNAGQFVHGPNAVFNGLNRLRIEDIDYAASNESFLVNDHQTLVTSNSTLVGTTVHREITVPSTGSQDYARTIDAFTNTESSAISVSVRLFGNLGSDDQTTVFATSDGDTIIEPTDTWFGTDDADPNGGTPAVIHWLRNSFDLSLMPTNVGVEEDNVQWTFQLGLMPGETKRIATFNVLGTTRQQAIDSVEALIAGDGLPVALEAGLSSEELASLANFQIARTPTAIQLANATVRENKHPGALVGDLYTIDENTSFGDTFQYSLVAGPGNTDNSKFYIENGRLYTSQSLDFESLPQALIRVRTTDASGLWTEQAVSIEVLDIEEIPPTVTSTSFDAAGAVIDGATTITVYFSEQVVGAEDVNNYELRGTSSDGLLLAANSVTHPTSVTHYGTYAVLTFANLDQDVYRLTISDQLTDLVDNRLDGDSDGVSSGLYQRDFVVTGRQVVGLAPAFGDGDGFASHNFNASDLRYTSMAVQPDGKILLAGYDALPGAPFNARWAIVRFNSDGSYDGYFDSSAQPAAAYNPGLGGRIQSLAVQPDGKILVARDFEYFGSSAAIFRLNANLTWDSTYGILGSANVYYEPLLTNYTKVAKIAVQPDGKVLMAGTYGVTRRDGFGLPTGEDTKVFVTRFLPSGLVDTSFGQNGYSTRYFLSTAKDLLFGNDGKIYVLANYYEPPFFFGFPFLSAQVWRLNADGSTDTSYLGGNTELALTGISGNSLVQQSDGKIVVIGSADDFIYGTTAIAARYTTSGALDSSFAGNGIVRYSALTYSGAEAGLVQSDGKLVLGGYGYDGNRFVSSVSRFNPNGSIDLSFGANGAFTYSFGNGNNSISNLFLESSDSLLATGFARTNNVLSFAAARISYDLSRLQRTLPSGTPITLDASQFGSGQIIDGPLGAFDGVNRLRVGTDNFIPTTSISERDNGRTVQFGPATMSDLSVSRRVYVPQSGSIDFIRTIEEFSNPTSSTVSTLFSLIGNLGSDASTVVFATSDGDTIIEPTDLWVGTDDSDPNGGLPAVIHLIQGPSALGVRVSANVTDDNTVWNGTIVVDPGATKRIATFTLTAGSRDQALSAVSSLISTDELSSLAVQYLTSDEVASIANFQFDKAPTNLSLSNNLIFENNASDAFVGTFSVDDANFNYHDAHTFTLVAGGGDSDNGFFTLSNNALFINATQDYEIRNSYSIRVRSTDLSGLTTEAVFSILIGDIDETVPTVLGTAIPSNSTMSVGTHTIMVEFSESGLPIDVSQFQLRRAGADGLLLANDNFVNPTSLTINGRRVALNFAEPFAQDTYRLTILDSIIDGGQNALDGDGDGLAGGNWRSDFVVTPSQVIRSSTNSAGAQANNWSDWPTLSTDGRFVAFSSLASNLVPGDNNDNFDIFIKDNVTGNVRLASVSSSNIIGDGPSAFPVLSADGRYVTFWSFATNLVAGDTNDTADLFKKDLLTGEINRVSVNAVGQQGNGEFSIPAMSADGRYIVFYSNASNLVDGDTTSSFDVFLKDTQTGNATLIDTASNNYLGFDVSYQPTISPDGRYIAFVNSTGTLVPGDTNGTFDVFVRDLQANTTSRVSTSSSNAQANQAADSPTLSANGRYVAFVSRANNLVSDDTNDAFDVFVKDTVTGQLTRVSTSSDLAQANADSANPALSADGRYVAFESSANNLVDGDTNDQIDVFIKDLQTGEIRRLSTDTSGTQANGATYRPVFSADGKSIAFYGSAVNLVPGDTNASYDTFQVGNPFLGVTDAITLSAPSGRSWEIARRGNVGQLNQGTDNAFNGMNRLAVDGVTFTSASTSTLDNNGRTIVSPTLTISGLDVTREVTIAAAGSQDFARTIEVFTNPTSAAITVPVRLLGNLGSDAGTTVFATSDGDLMVEPTDSWFATDDADPDGGTPAVVHLLRGLSPESLMPTSLQVLEDNVDWSFEITVNPGEIVRLATFTVLGSTRQQAIDAVSALLTDTDFTGHAADYLDSGELASLANFQFDQPRPSVTITNATIAENNPIGAMIGSLAESDSHGDEVYVYSFVSGEGSQDNDQFSIVGNELRANARFDFESQSSYSIRVRSTDADGTWTESQMTILVTDMLELTQPAQIGDGTAQRSIVNKMILNFDQAISLDDDAFVVERRGRAADGSLVLTRVTTAATITNLANGGVRVTLTFSGALTLAGTHGLVDGNYQLTIDGAKIHMLSTGGTFDADGDGIDGGNYVLGDDEVDNFFALFGDTNGDRQIGVGEFGQFRNAFGKRVGDAGYNQAFDIDGDGNIGVNEFGQFRNRFGKPKMGW